MLSCCVVDDDDDDDDESAWEHRAPTLPFPLFLVSAFIVLMNDDFLASVLCR